jgi:outer membrane lipoprotein-sorting protein
MAIPVDDVEKRVGRRTVGLGAIGAMAGLVLPHAANAAQSKGVIATDDPDFNRIITRVEDYFGAIKTLSARFVQIGPNGELASGKFYLRRPGRLRFEYDSPSPLLVVADGIWLVLHDKELEQVDRFPLFSTPISVLVAEQIDLRGDDVKVSRVERQPGILRLRLIDTDKPDEGWLSLAFSDPPITLRNWHVKDALGGITNVALDEMEVNIPLDPALFTFFDPVPNSRE